ncbi:MAG TPA: hypothetical protein VI818_01985, partial [Candidatus Thermoplasmatota archaeon]|nr:hypothetical protein [Candidatus Thermoplasmatota archaeon]
DWVERGAFENTVRGLRESVDGLRREVAAQQAPGQPAGSAVLERRVDELEGRARGVDASLTKLSARQDSLEARPKEPARSKRGSTRPESLAALREILGEDDEAEPAPRPEQAATLAASLLPGEGLAKAQAFAANLWLAGLVMGPPAPFYEVGRFGACLVPTCEAAPKGFVPVFDLTRPRGPGVLPGLACPAHADPPPWAVYLRRGMNRRDADLAVEAFVTLGESLGLPEPPSLSSQRVHVFGSAAARREWDLAVKRRGTR